jgi:uncharacterized protein YecE (DUF72 family)
MVHTGTCSWTEKTLIQSGLFYPPAAKTAEARLRYYSSQFDTVEVDSTYYAIPDAKSAWLWDLRTPPGFTFHIKAYGALTGHGVDPRTLPGDVQGLLPHAEGDKKFVYIKDHTLLHLLATRLATALDPLRRAGKLGLVVFQYPPWFTYKTSSFDHMLFCSELMNGVSVAVEFRHGSWLRPENVPTTLDFLRKHNLTYVTADEPQYGNLSTVPFFPAVTTDTAYFRFHGRNTENWLKKGIETSLRYAYLYGDEELTGFSTPVTAAEKETKRTFAMFNNCYRDYAVVNALRMRQLLKKT